MKFPSGLADMLRVHLPVSDAQEGKNVLPPKCTKVNTSRCLENRKGRNVRAPARPVRRPGGKHVLHAREAHSDVRYLARVRNCRPAGAGFRLGLEFVQRQESANEVPDASG